MSALKWQDEYTVGVEELDDQHQDLLRVINLVISEQEDNYKKEKFSATITSLIHYAYTHFATEERYLMQANFPDLKKHVIEHIDFIMKTLGLALKIEEGRDDTRKELLLYLKDWFSSHVLGLDRHYIPFLSSKKIS